MKRGRPHRYTLRQVAMGTPMALPCSRKRTYPPMESTIWHEALFVEA